MMQLSHYRMETLHRDGEFILYRGLCQTNAKTIPQSILALSPIFERPAPATLKKIEHEFSLKDELDSAWAIRPIALTQDESRTMLLFEDAHGEPLDRLLGRPLDPTRQCARADVAIQTALNTWGDGARQISSHQKSAESVRERECNSRRAQELRADSPSNA